MTIAVPAPVLMVDGRRRMERLGYDVAAAGSHGELTAGTPGRRLVIDVHARSDVDSEVLLSRRPPPYAALTTALGVLVGGVLAGLVVVPAQRRYRSRSEVARALTLGLWIPASLLLALLSAVQLARLSTPGSTGRQVAVPDAPWSMVVDVGFRPLSFLAAGLAGAALVLVLAARRDDAPAQGAAAR